MLDSIDPVVAGAPAPTGPDEITELADQILRGVYTGDFAIALDRAAAFCRIMAAGATSLADDAEPTSPDSASELTRRAARFATTGQELSDCAAMQRSEILDQIAKPEPEPRRSRAARRRVRHAERTCAAGAAAHRTSHRAARPRNASRRMAARSGE